MKQLLLCLLMSAGFSLAASAQDADLEKKNVSDTILQNRTLTLPDPFDAQLALQQLFPGKVYNMAKKKPVDFLINWECKTCKRQPYPDANEDANGDFPFSDGVATRLINVMDYTDSAGTKYKVISFNHSTYDPDGLQVSRFTGGLLGLAKFVLTGGSWKLRHFQPAIGAYGAFSQCPAPKPVLIGKDQYAYLIRHSNGPAGGPYYGEYYLIAGTGGAYKPVLFVGGAELSALPLSEGFSFWTGDFRIPVSDKKYFRDVIVTLKGTYRSTDGENLPEEVKPLVKGKKTCRFTVVRRYVYKGSKGYELQEPGKVEIQ
ncbi:MAG TPA: hypothetical protein VM802_03875 [Chitinophaga sp.]|uniref:hypothetical protein n=1 Tax=Chitinophaga sp. TaxID=1869181 RepID=UPI002BA61A86|nr:hypothetical protein [Chitinophaga sp.]HVI43974.1 hypothetical protein [Chitinophaga sp.]